MKVVTNVLWSLFALLSLSWMPSLFGGITEEIFFSSKNYAANIEIRGWVVTEAQLREVFADMKDPVQLTYRELDDSLIYFLIKINNLQCYRAWGTLKVFSPVHDATLDILNIEPRRDNYIYYVVPIGKYGYPETKYDQKPTVSFKWKKLYVK